MIATGGTALRSMVWPSEPSVCDQLVMDDLDHHLAGRDRLDDGGADRLLADVFGKTSDHVERDVGLEQRAAHLAHRGIDVGFRSAHRAPSADRECHQAFPTDCRTMPLSLCLSSPCASSQYAASRRVIRCAVDSIRSRRRCASPAGCRIFQTLLRPRAHRAVGRWPPASRTGRRVEKNIFPRSGGVKPSAAPRKSRKLDERYFGKEYKHCNRYEFRRLFLPATEFPRAGVAPYNRSRF